MRIIKDIKPGIIAIEKSPSSIAIAVDFQEKNLKIGIYTPIGLLLALTHFRI